MRLILGTSTSSSSSMVKLPLHQAHHGRRTGPKAKPKPNSKSKLSPDSKHSIAEFSSSTTSPPPPTVPSSQARLLSSVRWDFTSQHKYHADLASKLAEGGRLEEFVMIVESVVVSGGSGSNFVSLLRFELVSRGIVGSLLEGRFHCVAGVLKKVEKLGVAPLELFDGSSFQILKKECEKMVDCGEMEKFVDLIDTLAGFRFPIKELGDSSRVVKYCVDKRDTNLAIRYGSIFPHAHILFCTIILEFGKKKDLVSALTVYEASKKNLIGPNMYIYRTIIDVCGLCGDYMQSRSIYEDLLRQKIALNIYVFNSVMNVNAHDLDFSLQVYKNIKELGIVADMTSYNILLKACCLAGRVDLAQKIYGKVKRLESKGVLKLDVFTYSTIVKVFADAKLWQMALEIKEDMLSAGVTPNTVTWSSLINACANAGLVEQALHLFDDMLLAGCEPNSQCCNILLQACVEACQYDRAFRLFYSWKQRSSHEAFCEDCDGNHGSILSTEPKQNHSVSDNGTQSFVSNPRHLSFVKSFLFKPTTTTYNILMKACGTDYYHAKALMDEMRTADLSPNHISWSILIDTCGGLGNVEGAVQILNNMREAGINPDVVAYTAAIKVCVKNKSLKLAFSLFGEMKQYQIKPNLVTYNTLLRARSRYGSLHEVQQCLAVYQDMRKAGFKSDDHYLEELIEEWCEGVIQHNNQNQKELTSSKGTNLRPQSLLLEKVADHLQKSTTDSLAVDLRGLTKVEARIVILAVLRMIKENHSLGIPVKDDMLIILGPNKVGVNPAKYEELEVKDAITKLLHNDLGINVSLVRPTTAHDKNVDLDKPLDSDPNSEEILGRLQMKFKSSTRRPAILQRLKVTKKSLHCWLQRRTGASTR